MLQNSQSTDKVKVNYKRHYLESTKIPITLNSIPNDIIAISYTESFEYQRNWKPDTRAKSN